MKLSDFETLTIFEKAVILMLEHINRNLEIIANEDSE